MENALNFCEKDLYKQGQRAKFPYAEAASHSMKEMSAMLINKVIHNFKHIVRER
jgi:hypothetical protein